MFKDNLVGGESAGTVSAIACRMSMTQSSSEMVCIAGGLQFAQGHEMRSYVEVQAADETLLPGTMRFCNQRAREPLEFLPVLATA